MGVCVIFAHIVPVLGHRCVGGKLFQPDVVVLMQAAPHRSQRAELPHWAPASGVGVKAHTGPGMRDAGGRQPSSGEAVHPVPADPRALAAAPQRLEPVSDRLVAEGPDRFAVAGHGVVGEVPSHHACQPAPLLRDGEMPASQALVFDLGQLRPHPFRDRLTRQPEPPGAGLPADVREAEEVERLRLAQTPTSPVDGGEAPELDQPRLVRVQLQPELREPLAKLRQELLRVLLDTGTRRRSRRRTSR